MFAGPPGPPTAITTGASAPEPAHAAERRRRAGSAGQPEPIPSEGAHPSRPACRTGDPRDLLPRADLDVAAAAERSGRCARTFATVATPPCIEATEALRRGRPWRPGAACACRPPSCTRALEALDPPVRAALEEAIRRTRRVTEATRPRDVSVEVMPGSCVTERWVPVSRVGLYVPGGRVAYPEQRRDERRPGAGRRRRVAGRRLAAAARDRAAAPRRARRLRAARHRRGVRGRRCAGGRDVRLRHPKLPAGRRHHRPGQRLRRRGQAAGARGRRHRRGSGRDRDRHPRRRHGRPGVPRRRPALAGRARSARRLPAGFRQRRRCSTPWRPEVGRQVAAAKHHERITAALTGQSAMVLVAMSSRASRWSTPGPPSTSRS